MAYVPIEIWCVMLFVPQIEKCKGLLRESIKYCDEAEGDQSIPEDAYDAAGELDASAIFCAKCLSFESFEVCLTYTTGLTIP